MALEYICHVHNKTASKVLGWKTPWAIRTGETPDVSEILPFAFWELVYYKPNNDDKEQLGHFVGFAEHVGDNFCFKILTENGQVVSKSKVRSARDQSRPNNRVFNLDIPVTGVPPSGLSNPDSRGGDCITTNMSNKQNMVVKDKLRLLLRSEEIRTVKTKDGEKKARYSSLTQFSLKA